MWGQKLGACRQFKVPTSLELRVPPALNTTHQSRHHSTPQLHPARLATPFHVMLLISSREWLFLGLAFYCSQRGRPKLLPVLAILGPVDLRETTPKCFDRERTLHCKTPLTASMDKESEGSTSHLLICVLRGDGQHPKT